MMEGDDLVFRKACVVMPTYNERENISKMLDKLLAVFASISDFEMHVLVVDDNSPDGTGSIVTEYANRYTNIHLLQGRKEGLGKAYIRGFAYAIEELKAEYIFEMDADFSHNPEDLLRLLEATKDGSDFIIGSRYISGGSIPDDWGLMRVLNSKAGNLVARNIAGIYSIHDCTGGYRCISADLIKKIKLKRMNAAGYSFQINLLFECMLLGAKVREVPIKFIDREFGKSKIRMKDRTEFIRNSFKLRARKSQDRILRVTVGAFFIFAILPIGGGFKGNSFATLLINFYLMVSVILLVQGIINLYMTLYIWEKPEMVERNKVPEKFLKPSRSFSILLPARNEEAVISNTIQGLHNINYPKDLMEIVVICEKSDIGTIKEVQNRIRQIKDESVKLVIFNDKPVNKPHALNKGLAVAKNEIITIYDAEDEVNPDIFNAINTVMEQNNDVGIVQSGVQLMNYDSKWFSVHNVLEYYFWFKSRLHFHADIGMIPLGGNSVFFRSSLLKDINGWDENCLTEDADIGIRLSTQGVKTMVVYDELFVTREETPDSLKSFIKQRTRWVQGFLQVYLKYDWKRYPTLAQRIVAVYVLLIVFLQAAIIALLPISIFIMIKFKLGALASMILIMPIYLLLTQLTVSLLGIHEFLKAYKIHVKYSSFINLIITFFPYQLLLGISALRGLLRQITGKNNWEKTMHLGIHRNLVYEKSMDIEN